ncbi:MAG: hypothetical protein LUE27_04290 [Clostridia bacterium]|nr:hypothetical protein [Clostridia bacterium]
MKKTYQIDFSDDRLLSVADNLFDEGRYVEALRILNKNASLNGNDEESYFMYAEIYDELDLQDKAIHNLFKSLDYSDREDPAECYKGLSICYMNVGDRKMCSYYYSMYLEKGGDTDPDENMDDVVDFIQADLKKKPLKFVYPPEIADFTDEFDKGVMQAMDDKTDEAMETFGQIPEGNSLYVNARMNIATCQLMQGNPDAAKKECLRILDKDPYNLLALINLGNVYIEKKQYKQAKKLAQKLQTFHTDNREELYKIATIYCETDMHKEAYDCFTYMMEELDVHHLNVLYYRAIAAFNAGMGQEAMDAISLAMDIFPVSVVILYTKAVIYEAVKSEQYFEMDYSFGLPEDMTNEYKALLLMFMTISRTKAVQCYKNTEILDVIFWCFDGEYMEDRTEAQDAALSVCVKIGEYDIVRDFLLERRIANKVKMNALIQLAQRNVDESYGIVISDIMFRVVYMKVSIGRRKRSNFLEAYGTITARFSFIDENLGAMMMPVVEKVYRRMELMEILDQSEDTRTLGMVMYCHCGLGFNKIDFETMASIVGTDKSKVSRLMKTIGVI